MRGRWLVALLLVGGVAGEIDWVVYTQCTQTQLRFRRTGSSTEIGGSGTPCPNGANGQTKLNTTTGDERILYACRNSLSSSTVRPELCEPDQPGQNFDYVCHSVQASGLCATSEIVDVADVHHNAVMFACGAHLVRCGYHSDRGLASAFASCDAPAASAMCGEPTAVTVFFNKVLVGCKGTSTLHSYVVGAGFSTIQVHEDTRTSTAIVPCVNSHPTSLSVAEDDSILYTCAGATATTVGYCPCFVPPAGSACTGVSSTCSTAVSVCAKEASGLVHSWEYSHGEYVQVLCGKDGAEDCRVANYPMPPSLPPTLGPTAAPATGNILGTPTRMPAPWNSGATPTEAPSTSPTAAPRPTAAPAQPPTLRPTQPPTASPQDAPTARPTAQPTAAPTVPPTGAPMRPTAAPTAKPTASPTAPPTAGPLLPTAAPTMQPMAAPTAAPTVQPTAEPMAAPTAAPTVPPTAAPVAHPTLQPTAAPTVQPTAAPVAHPTLQPTAAPTVQPTAAPAAHPTPQPTAAPTVQPTAEPMAAPTAAPTVQPTAAPAAHPTPQPTAAPTSGPVAGLQPTIAPTAGPLRPTAPPLPPTTAPATLPTASPTMQPTTPPSLPPAAAPTAAPSARPPTAGPSVPPVGQLPPSPSAAPSAAPEAQPANSSVSPTATPAASASISAPSAPPSAPPSATPSLSPTAPPSASDSPTTQPTPAPTPKPGLLDEPVVQRRDEVGATVAVLTALGAAGGSQMAMVSPECRSLGTMHGLSPTLHPTGISVQGSMYLGCLVGSVMIICGAAVLSFTALFLLKRVDKDGDGVLSKAEIQATFLRYVPIMRNSESLDISAMARHPNTILVAFLFVYQGAAFSSFRLVLAPDGSGGAGMRAIGAISAALLAAAPVFVFHRVRLGVEPRMRAEQPGQGPKRRARIRDWGTAAPPMWLQYVLLSEQGDWVSCHRNPHWINRWQAAVRPYEAPHAAHGSAVELTCMWTLSLVTAPVTDSWVACGNVRMAGAVVLALQLVYSLWQRPFRCFRDDVAETVRLALLVASLATLAVEFYKEGNDTTVAVYMLQVVTLVTMLRCVLQIVAEVFLLLTGYRAKIQADEWRENAGLPDSSFTGSTKTSDNAASEPTRLSFQGTTPEMLVFESVETPMLPRTPQLTPSENQSPISFPRPSESTSARRGRMLRHSTYGPVSGHASTRGRGVSGGFGSSGGSPNSSPRVSQRAGRALPLRLAMTTRAPERQRPVRTRTPGPSFLAVSASTFGDAAAGDRRSVHL